MKFKDLFLMCFHNLFRRKLRTALTVIGVVIGTCSIVLMVSLGVGLDKSYSEQIAQWTDITMIDVFYDDFSEEATMAVDTDTPKIKLDDDAIEYISSMPHVEGVSPIMQFDSDMLNITSGRYQFMGSVVAMNLEELSKMGYELKSGTTPTKNDGENAIIVGERSGYSFYDPNGGGEEQQYDQENGGPPPVDVLNDNIRVSIKLRGTEAAGSMEGMEGTVGTVGTGETEIPITSKTGGKIDKLKTMGQFKANQAKDFNTMDGIFISIDFARNLRKQYDKLMGTKDSFKSYNNAKIKVDDFANVEQVEEKLKSFGFSTYSAKQELEQAKSTSKIIQLILGALGGISLIVAAIGITNTMVMSIYERTREIGVMKVLGCELKNIRMLFLMEAGGIGLMGGVIGLVISYTISFVINKLSASFMGEMMGTSGISQIPFWLALVGIGFSIMVGIISGYAPANRAVKISALSAIKTE